MFEFWRKWFVTVAAAMVVLGLGFAVLGLTPAIAWVGAIYDPAFWGAAGADAPGRAFQTFAYGVMGALMMGWGILAFGVGRHALRPGVRWAWLYAADSVAVWFVVDCAMSWASGATVNIVGNVIFLALLAPPLIGMRKQALGEPGPGAS